MVLINPQMTQKKRTTAKVTWLVFSKSEILNANGANDAKKMKLTAKA
jgi:hypothetical protein